jgi:hypothetical protein
VKLVSSSIRPRDPHHGCPPFFVANPCISKQLEPVWLASGSQESRQKSRAQWICWQCDTATDATARGIRSRRSISKLLVLSWVKVRLVRIVSKQKSLPNVACYLYF